MFKSITSVDIENFQIHESLSLEFSNFTAIVGATDRGKSSVLRAINWCLYNSPSGSDFITQGKSRCSVTLKFSDGTVITRTKGAGVNSYDIHTTFDGGADFHFEGFGTGPLEEVIQAHGMREVDYFGEKQSLNVCKQLDQPFFLGETPTTKALIIGKLANTDVIDLSIKNTSSDIRNCKATMKEYKAKLKTVKEDLSNYKGLNMMGKAIEYCDARLDKIKLLEMKLKNIESVAYKLSRLKAKKEELDLLLQDAENIDNLISMIDDIEIQLSKLNSIVKSNSGLKDSALKMNKLKELTDKVCIEEIEAEIDILNGIVTDVKSVKAIALLNKKILGLKDNYNKLREIGDIENIQDTINDLSRATDLMSVLKNITTIASKRESALSRAEAGNRVISKLEFQRTNSINKYKDLLVESKTCPVCMSGIEADKLDDIDKMI